MTHRLNRLLAPQSIALIGASDRSNWSHRINGALEVIGYEGRLFYVNPRGGEAHGKPLYRSVQDIDEPVDLAFLMVPDAAVLPAMRDVAQAGIKAAVVLSSGFAELGEEGRAAQGELADLCHRNDMVVLGPNALGFVNTGGRVALKPFQPGEELRSGSIAVVSQSGNITVQIMNMARAFDVGLSYAVSTGNEMDVTVADVVDFLAEDESTRAIAVFAEAFPDPHAFLAACKKARVAGKVVVVLKVGRSEAAARAALAHTGSLVGNDAVVDAFLRAAGVIRVSSTEDLLTVCDTFAHTGPIASGVGLLTISGGTCDIVADRAEELSLSMPDFCASTVNDLEKLLPHFASVHNPLDVTGAAVTDAALFARAFESVMSDPGIGLAIAVQENDHQAENVAAGYDAAKLLAEAANAASTPAILANTTPRYVSARVREIRRELDIPTVFGGVDRILPAVKRIQEWTEAPLPPTDASPLALATEAEPGAVWTESKCRPLLASADVPVVPGEVAATPGAVAEIAAGYGGEVVIKVLSDEILHKSDVGGVALEVSAEGAADVAAQMATNVRFVLPDARIEGFLVSPMRPDGLDLLVGVVREPDWGNVLAIGLGGIWAEVLHDIQRIALPASPAQIEAALRALQAWPLFEGARGTEPVDLAGLTSVIERIADLSLGLGDQLAAFEVNPLRVRGMQVEALDAAIVWSAESEGSGAST